MEKDVFKISFEKDDFLEISEFPHPLQKAVMPIILKVGEEMIPLGTAFSISNFGLMLTARHVIEDIYNDYMKETKDNPNREIPITQCELYVLYISEIRHGENNQNYLGGLLPVTRVTFSKDSDIALLTLHVPEINGEPLFLPAFRLSPGLPSLNQNTMAFGYSKMKANEEVTNHLQYAQNFNTAKGRIEEIHGYKRDNVMINFPCFRTDARYDSGMSGGPIMGENGNVIGIISSCMPIEDEQKTYTSYGVLLPIAFTLNALVILNKEVGPKEYSLYELAKAGRIPVDDTLSNVSFNTKDGVTHLIYK